MVINIAARFKDETEPEMSNSKRKFDDYNEKLRKVEEQIDRLGKEKINAKADLEDKATSKLEKIMRTSKSLAGKTYSFAVKAVDYATAPLRKIMNMATSLKGIIAMVTAKLAIDKTIIKPIQMADTLTNAQIGFETLLGSEQAAVQKMAEIKEFAAKTPYDTMGVVQNVQQMLNSGWDVDSVMKDMEKIGNAAAATGNSTEGFSRIVTAINQMRMAGKVNSQDMMQLTNANLPGWQLMAEGLGVTVKELRALVKDGTVDAEIGIQGLLKGFEKYNGMMDDISQKTVSGIWSNIKDTLDIKVFERWGAGLKEGSIEGFSALVDFLDKSDAKLIKLGDKLYEIGSLLSNNVANAAEKALAKIIEISESPEFASASLGGKVKLMFDGVIGEPLSDWWNSKGKEQAQNIATEFGRLLGVGIVKGVGEGVKGIALDASTLLPGGEKASSSSLLSTAALGFGAYKLGAGKLFGKLFSGKSAAKVASDMSYTAFWENVNLTKTVSRADVMKSTQTSGALGKFFKSVGDDLLVDAARLHPKLVKIGGSMKGLLKGSWLSLLMSGAAVAQADDKWGEAAKQSGSLAGGLAGGKLGAMLGTLIAPGIGTAIGSALGSIGGFIGGEKLMDKIIGDFDVSEFIGSVATGTRQVKEMRESLSEATEKAQTMASNYKDINDCLWKYQYLQDILNDPESNRSVEDRKRIQEEINGLVQQLHDFYPNLISQYDVENGKLSANLATIKEIAAIDRDRARNELETEIGKQKDEFEKNDVAERLSKSDEKINEGNRTAKAMQEDLSLLTEYNAELEKLLRLKEQHKEEGDWTSYSKDFNEITDYMEKVNEIMEKYDLKTYKPGVNGAEKFTDVGIDKFVEDRQKVVDAITEEYQLNDQLKATYQELYNSQKALIELDLGGTIEETAAKYDTLSDEQKKAFDKALTQIEALQAEMNLLTEKEHIVNIKVVKTQAYGEEVANSSNSGIGKNSILPYANGGILNKPHVGLVAEDGAEAIIPLSSKRRKRGLDLWVAAGKALGVRAYADGGITDNSEKIADATSNASTAWSIAEKVSKLGKMNKATKAISATTKKVPFLGNALSIGSIALNVKNAKEDEKKEKLVSGIGGLAGNIAGGALVGAGLGALGANPITVVGGSIVGGIAGGIAGEKTSDIAFNKFNELNEQTKSDTTSIPHTGLMSTRVSEPVSYKQNANGNAAILASNGSNMLSGTNTPSINLGGVEVNLNIPSGVSDADGILQAIRAQMPDIANEICRYIAINMSKVKGNVVTTGGV
jgi:tape measure domain-containing protein